MRARDLPALQRGLGRFTGGPTAADAVRTAGELVARGFAVALEHVPPGATGALTVLVARLVQTGLAEACELALRLDVLGRSAEQLATRILDAGPGVALLGPSEPADRLAARLRAARVVVPAGDVDAEERCRLLSAGRVRLVEGRGAGADLAFVRCLNVLMSGPGQPAVAATDRRLIAIASERAAWYDRPADSWEYVMPLAIRTDEQRRLVAAGHRVRVAVPWGPGAATAALRGLARRA